MSEGCGNPNCPSHGKTPEAAAARQAMQEIKSNDELMDVVRIISANVLQGLAEEAHRQGLPPAPTDAPMIAAILSGNYDASPVVKGVLKGLCVLLTGSHEPTKVFANNCREIEAPHVVERLQAVEAEKEPTRPRAQFIPGVGMVMSFGSMEELNAFLKENR